MKGHMSKHEFFDEYGDVEVSFGDYYKYIFSFYGDTEEDGKMKIDVGGDRETIYKYSVSASHSAPASAIKDQAMSGYVFDENGEVVRYFVDYYI